MNDMSTPSELCSLQKCLNSTDVAYFEYSGVRYMFLPLDINDSLLITTLRHTHIEKVNFQNTLLT